jgi:hypothetical protein
MCFLLDLSLPRNALARENHPPVQGGGSLLTPAARADSGGVSHALDDIPKADLLIANEPRQSNAKRLAL